MSNRFTKGSLLAGTIMAGAMISTPVYAQATDENDVTDQETALQAGPEAVGLEESLDEGEYIVVTGSRIQRRNTETAAPIAVVQDEEFKLSGTVNVENVINTLPQVVPGFTSASNNPGLGVSTVNLRGLGESRTLVLVNGRRWMFFDVNQLVDLNTIPAFLIDSVDVVTGGASAVYGSDALAGVVNFRLRHVDGLEAGGQYKLTDEGDGAAYELYGAMGTEFADGRGDVTVFAEYYNRDSIFAAARDATFFALGDGDGELVPGGSSTLTDGVLRYFGGATGLGTAAGTEFGAATGNSSAVVFDEAGNFRNRVADDLYNYAPTNYLQIPQERYLLGGFADYEYSDGHEFYTEVSFVNNRVATELAPTPVTGFFDVNLAAVQGFFAPGDFAQLQQIDASETAANLAAGEVDDPGVLNLFVQRRTNEVGSRNQLDERNAFRVLGGARGAITDWLNYDAYYMYARTRNAQVQAGNVSASAFAAGLDGTAPAINIFGPNTLTSAMADQISILAQNGDISTLEVANAALSGFLGNFGMGAEDIGFALGVEYRKVASEFIPDTALSSGDVIGFNAGDATAGSYDVREVFGEVNIPIIEDSFIERLEIQGAARYSDYSLEAVGGVWTYAGGIELAPIPDITFRAQYQHAIRAPNVAELFQGQAIGFPPATDPCATAAAAAPGALRDLCLATGVPASSVGQPGLQLNPQIPALFGGNPNLQEETSDSWTAGVVIEPRFIPGLLITADYFNIEIENAIASLGGGLANALDLCYNQVQDINSPICQIFVGTRNSGGSFDTANPPLISQANIASLTSKGVDLEVSYGTQLPFSLMTDAEEMDVNFGFLGTWTEEANFTPIVGLDRVDECAGRFGLVCGEPTPEYKWTSRLSFIDGPLTTSIRWRHLSSVEDDDDTTVYVVEEIPSYDVFDISFAFDVTEQFSISMGSNNVFDKDFFPVGTNQEQSNTYPSTYDVFGRQFFVSGSFLF